MIGGFEVRPSDRKIYAEEFDAVLPEKIIDSHVHLWSRENLKIPKEEYALYKDYKPWTDFDYMEEFLLEDYERCTRECFPGRKIEPFVFGSPFPQVDRDRTNRYILEISERGKKNFYYIPGQYEDMFETEDALGLMKRKGFLGLKPYPEIPVVKTGEAGIYDMLNTSALEYADKHGLFIVLHIPRKQRLRSEDNRRELVECFTHYPNAKFIIAHVGRAFTYYDVKGQIEFMLPFENVLFDLALINSETVIKYLLEKVGASRVLFGSDTPLAFTRGKDITVNNHHYYVSEKAVPWGLGPIKEGFADFTYYFYEEIRAVLYAVGEVYGKAQAGPLEQLFLKNAEDIIRERNGYGI